jgi:hypothetical protein
LDPPWDRPAKLDQERAWAREGCDLESDHVVCIPSHDEGLLSTLWVTWQRAISESKTVRFRDARDDAAGRENGDGSHRYLGDDDVAGLQGALSGETRMLR